MTILGGRRYRCPFAKKDGGSERVAFNKQRYGADIADPVHYDLVVNAGFLRLEGAAELTVRAYETRFGT